MSRRIAIAIVGIGCRFPGADGPSQYWSLLCDGRDATSPIPHSRRDYRLRGILGRIVGRGGFVEGIEEFDPYFFGLSPREAVGLDPQTRLLFEAAWRSAEDAGLTSDQLRAVRTGVFVGLCSDDYSRLILNHSPDMDFQATFGASRSSGSGRISHALRLTGPSATVDTACSSSLAAVHLAVRAIQHGDCELAFAGGANILLTPENTASFMRGGLLSAVGRCEAFRAGADGFVRSEGAGMVLLKPLHEALADNDRIYAVVRGSSMNNDGGESLYMAPSVTGQVRVAQAALEESGVGPGDVQYVEAHGTGTRVGDPTEAQALMTTFCEGRTSENALRIGSCKANIGHLEAAAGVAGLIKAALALHHAELPPSIHADPINPDIPWDEWHLRVQTQREPWPATAGLRGAAVNSFGITGTNAHVVLTSAPGRVAVAPASVGPSFHLLPISARDEVSLKTLAIEWEQTLATRNDRLSDLCYTASLRRTHFECRLAIVGRTPDELRERISSWLGGLSGSGGQTVAGVVADRARPASKHRPVFVYSGIGSQWPRMALELYERHPVFRASFDRISRLFADLSGLQLIDEIRRDAESSKVDRVQIMQPALFALQIALTDLWRSWGVQPAAVVGHSLGEAAAACVAGAISLEDAARYVHVRSDCLARTEEIGGMLALGVTPARAADVIRGLEDRLSIGVVTTRESVVLSGDRAALAGIEDQFRNSDVFCRQVNASVATHSPLMDPFLPEIARRIAGLEARPASLPFYSTVTGAQHDGLELTPDYWVRNIRGCVLFGPAMERMLADGARSFVEVSAHPLLVQPMQETATARSISALVVPTLRRNTDSEASMLEAFGRLFAAGHPVDWQAHRQPDTQHVDVPGHPFRRERLWVRDDTVAASAEQTYSRLARPDGHALLPIRFDAPDRSGTVMWQVTLDPMDHPFLAQHVVGSQQTLPLVTYIELALAAATEILGTGPKTFRNLRCLKGQFFAPGGTIALRIVFAPAGVDSHAIAFYVQNGDGEPELSCEVTVSERGPMAPFDPGVSPSRDRERFPVAVSLERLHETHRLHGFEYGPLFHGTREGWRGEDEGLTRIHYLPELRQERGFHLHPAFLDAALHRPFIGYKYEQGDPPIFRLPVSIDEIHVSGPIEGEFFWGYGRTSSGPGWERYDDWLLNDAGEPLVMIRGLLARELDQGPTTEDASTTEWMYDTTWESIGKAVPDETPGKWLVIGDGAAPRELCARLESFGHACQTASIQERFTPERFDLSTEIPWRGIAYALPEHANAAEEFQRTVCGGLLDLLNACASTEWKQAPRVFVVSRSARKVLETDRPQVALAPTIGLARVSTSEFPAFRVTVVDRDGGGDDADSLVAELLGQWSGEADVALRGSIRYGSRLVRLDVEGLARRTKLLRLTESSSSSYRVVSRRPGALDGIVLELAERRAPGPTEVEIRITAGGLNFLDVLRSLGMGPAQAPGEIAFGMECAGVVVRVGDRVTTFTPGQRVVALAMSEGCFRAHLTIPERFAFAVPTNTDLKDAATWLVAYQTAWYALNEMGRLRKGEKVLIHAAAGGVGLAAVHVAKYLGCEVYATAGSTEKREYLKRLGVTHVLNSRTLEFADEIMALTEGRGVDAVLNSIAGEAIPKSLSVLAMGGRFLEIGKRDIYSNAKLELLPFRRNLSYYAIDMLGLTLECEDRALRVTDEVVELLRRGDLPALPSVAFAAAQAPDAFRYMAQSKHTGKVLLTFEQETLDVEIPAARVVRPDATYLITGGVSGIGLACASWLASQGATRLVLASRRGPGADSGVVVDGLRQQGVTVEVVAADISKKDDAVSLVAQSRGDANRPLAGVIHAAGVLRDAVIPNLRWEQFDSVFAPKVAGTQNLLSALKLDEIDLLVLFSTIASTLASPGQASYVAANSYLDALSDALGAEHPSVLRINWGPWTRLGMLESGGLKPAPMFGEHGILPERGLAVLGELIGKRCSRAVVMPADWKVWRETVPQVASAPFFAQLSREMGESDSVESANGVAQMIAALPETEALALVASVLRDAVKRVLRIPEDRMENTVGLLQLGLDSLMAVELGHRVRSELGVTLSLMKLLRGPTVDDLAVILYPDVLAAGREPSAPASAEEVDQMTDEQVDALLEQYATESPQARSH